MADKLRFRWSVIAQSVRGASHLRNGLPNQDAIKFWPENTAEPPLILAVSDGHGSSKCFRSATGAKLAVEVSVEITNKFLEHIKASSLAAIEDAAKTLLTGEIVRTWTQRIGDDLLLNPFSSEELDQLGQSASRSGEHLLAYGATLLLVAVGESSDGEPFLFCLQLGDGDILFVWDKARQVDCPIAADPSLIANETTSLCMVGAERLFRFRFQAVRGQCPVLILVSTDGYSNAFATDKDFHKVGTDLLNMIEQDGLSGISQRLPSWLNEASQSGSGDDVTLGILCHQDVIGACRVVAAVDVEASQPPEQACGTEVA